jgi:hypothetical protein
VWFRLCFWFCNQIFIWLCEEKEKTLNQCHLELYPLHGMNKSFFFSWGGFCHVAIIFLGWSSTYISKFLRLKTSKFEGSFSSCGGPWGTLWVPLIGHLSFAFSCPTWRTLEFGTGSTISILHPFNGQWLERPTFFQQQFYILGVNGLGLTV